MTTADTRRRVLENRMRRVAYRHGYRITKDGPDRYMLVDVKTSKAVFGQDTSGRVFTASLADVEAWLEREDRKRKN